MKGLILTLLLFFCFYSSSLSQLGTNQDSHIPKIIPPSPDASALEKFTGIPVDYSTGVPSISHPIWSWEKGALRFNLGLSYHAGGHRVDDISSNVGLGWSLSGLPRISRTVRGAPDDHPGKGFFNTSNLPVAVTNLYNPDQYYIPDYFDYLLPYSAAEIISLGNNVPVYGLLESISKGALDAEQDIFSYNLGGISGRFIITKQQVIIPLEETNLKIEKVGANISSGFRITTDEGSVYEFTQTETQNSESFTDSEIIAESSYSEYVSSWIIKKIVAPNFTDSIIFNYSGFSEETRYETAFTQSESRFIFKHVFANTDPSLSSYNVTHNMSIINVSGHPLTSIDFPDGSSLHFGYDFARDDLEGGNALTSIEIKNLFKERFRKIQLHYSYFTAHNDNPSPVGWGYFSESDYHKRLRLDSISELDTSATKRKLTRFEYDPTKLNSRGSRNTDFWGYNANPARNNTVYMPTIKLDFAEAFALGGTHMPGANRMPDSVYGKAALLTKITYPTGGFVQFEYEGNRASSGIDYNQISNYVEAMTWNSPQFNTAKTLILPSGRTTDTVHFIFKVTEHIQPRPIQDPEQPALCLENQQDGMGAYFQVYSTDSTVFYTIGEYYGDFLHGFDTILVLPAGKTYRLKFSYNSSANCADMYAFDASASLYCQNSSNDDVLVGGMRIKRIVADPKGSGRPLIREYLYSLPDSTSSATLHTVPNYKYYRYTNAVCYDDLCRESYYANYIKMTSSPSNSLNFHNGSPLIYKRVVERFVDSSYYIRNYDDMVYYSLGGNPEQFPFPAIQDMPNLSGLLTKEVVATSDGTILKETNITYQKSVTNLVNNNAARNYKSGIVSSISFPQSTMPINYHVLVPTFFQVTYARKIKEETKIWSNGTYLRSVDSLTYFLPSNYLAAIHSTNSKGESRVQSMKYIVNESDILLNEMKSKNMISFPTQKQIYKPGVIDSNLVTTRYLYNSFQGGSVYAQESVDQKTLTNGYQTQITFDDYDAHGNIIQYTGKDGVITSLFWGYKNQYPVARIIGKSYQDALTLSGIDLAVLDSTQSDVVLQTELNKLRSLANCLVTTYTFKPLVGVSRETSPNGTVLQYVYDEFNRLHLVRDQDSNILKKICYNYVGQPIDCGAGEIAIWQADSSYCYNGFTIVRERDMNHMSPTYSQTRNITMDSPNPECSCVGANKKVINGVCETGVKVCTSSVRINQTTWLVTYHYRWSDNSVSGSYQEYGFACLGDPLDPL